DACFFTKFQRHTFAGLVYRKYRQVLGQPSQRGIAKKLFDRLRKPTVTILRLITNAEERFFISRGRNAFISSQALTHVVNVFIGYGHVDTEVDRYTGFIFDSLTAQLRDSTLEHLRVKVEAKRVHVARLLSSEKIAGAPQFEIQRGYAKSRPQVRKLSNRCQTAF